MNSRVEQLRQTYEQTISDWLGSCKDALHLKRAEDFLGAYMAWVEHRVVQGDMDLAKRAYEAALAYLRARDHHADCYWG